MSLTIPNPLIGALQQLSPIGNEAISALNSIIKFKKYPRNHTLLRLGQIDRYIHFISKGSARVYYLHNGIDVTDYIAMDMDFIGGLESLFTKTPTHKAIETIEPSEIYSFVHDEFEKLCDNFHELERVGRKLAIFAFLGAQKQIESIRFLSAAERYHELEKTYPGIANRIPLKFLASYIGTTQVSLSRIRKGIQ